MNVLLDLLIPRFMEERTVIERLGDGSIQPLYREADMAPGERGEVVTLRFLNVFGMALFPKVVPDE